MIDRKKEIHNYSGLFLSDFISQHHYSPLFWILGLFHGSPSFSSHDIHLNWKGCSNHLQGLRGRLRSTLFTPISPFGFNLQLFPFFSNFTLSIHNIYISPYSFYLSPINYKLTPYLTLSINESPIPIGFHKKIQSKELNFQNIKLPQNYKLIPPKLINLFYNIDPFFLNYFYHFNYTYLFHTYWFTGFLESNLTYFDVYFKNSSLKYEFAEPNYIRNDLTIFTSIIFEFHLYDKNYHNLLVLNKFFKGKILSIGHDYKLILKFPFGVNQILSLIQYLHNYPFLTSKYINYLKLRKIYRICQRKENYYHKGILSILKIATPKGS